MNIELKMIKYPDIKLKINESETNETRLNLKTRFKRTLMINRNNKNNRVLVLDCSIGEEDLPFYLHVTALGFFDIVGEFNQKEFQINATSQLFPYLRATVTQLTTMSNYPPIILPIPPNNSLFHEDNIETTTIDDTEDSDD